MRHRGRRAAIGGGLLLLLPFGALAATGGPCEYYPQETLRVEVMASSDSGVVVELLDQPRHADFVERGDRVDADPAEHADVAVGDRFALWLTTIRRGSCVPLYAWLGERIQLRPVDDTESSETFGAFRDDLEQVVDSRDTEALIEHAWSDITLGFGGSGGHADLRRMFSEPGDEAAWGALAQVLKHGAVRHGEDVYCLPYWACIDTQNLVENMDPFDMLFAIEADVPLRAGAAPDAEVLSTLVYTILRHRRSEGEAGPFIAVETIDGRAGYVHRDRVGSPVGYRLYAERREGEWGIRYFIAGD